MELNHLGDLLERLLLGGAQSQSEIRVIPVGQIEEKIRECQGRLCRKIHAAQEVSNQLQEVHRKLIHDTLLGQSLVSFQSCEEISKALYKLSSKAMLELQMSPDAQQIRVLQSLLETSRSQPPHSLPPQPPFPEFQPPHSSSQPPPPSGQALFTPTSVNLQNPLLQSQNFSRVGTSFCQNPFNVPSSTGASEQFTVASIPQFLQGFEISPVQFVELNPMQSAFGGCCGFFQRIVPNLNFSNFSSLLPLELNPSQTPLYRELGPFQRREPPLALQSSRQSSGRKKLISKQKK
jgi:hypothetical protein